eukprot:337912-Pleurochrysis_carterae.AAC.1
MPCMLVCEGALGGVEERRRGASHGAAQHTAVTFVRCRDRRGELSSTYECVTFSGLVEKRVKHFNYTRKAL